MGDQVFGKGVLEKEFADILERRTGLKEDENGQVLINLVEGLVSEASDGKQGQAKKDWSERDVRPDLQNRVGLALSGGGIRSATFGLGVVQYLGKMGHFPRFDYLSTVSGGGFLGSCLTSWYTASTQPEKKPEFPFVHGNDVESVPFQHLRNFSNYLAPKGGLLENMRMLAIFIRGLLINMFLVMPFLLLAVAYSLPSMLSMESKFIDILIAFLAKFKFTYTLSVFLAEFKFPYTLSAFLAVSAVFLLSTIFFSLGNDWIKWKVRNWVTLHLGLLVVIVGVIFFWELQPLMLSYFHQLHVYLDKYDGLAVGSLGGLSTLVYFFMDKLKSTGNSKESSSPWGKYALLGMAFLFVPLFFWGLFLFLAHRGLMWDGTCDLLAHAKLDSDVISQYKWWALGLLIVGMLFNINKYSLHVFYRDRLSRAYLIKPASKREWRTSRPEMNDTLKLSELKFLHAPYHLINAAVNVTKVDDSVDNADDFVNRGRTADFFLFSKHWVGSELTGYCSTEEMQLADPWLNLGTAMAISGAAFSPNMGTSSIKPLTALMTFFNIRLGYWLPNPLCFKSNMLFDGSKSSRKTTQNNPLKWLFFALAKWRYWYPPRKYLFNEALSSLSVEKDAFINVSDGGHIENLAIYPLLQRRCRLIIALDGEADKDYFFEGLATTIRLARINLNVQIKMDKAQLDDIHNGKRHFALGVIEYSQTCHGTLLYIKSSLCGQEAVDICHYKMTHPDFPHESTLDQFFDETQFEAYRSLGYHVAQEVFGGGKVPLAGSPSWCDS